MRFLSFFSDWLWSRRGLGRLGLAFLFGSLVALAFPPFNQIWVLWVSFPALVFLLQGAARARSAFAIGWAFAFGTMVFSLYWIAGSLFVDIRQFWWALPFAVAGLPACFALYYALAAALAWKWGLWRLDGVLMLGLLWALADFARGLLFTGFPWDLMGYVWSFSLPVLQITSVIGIWGLTLLTLLFAPLPALLERSLRSRASVALVAAFCCLFLALGGGGAYRLHVTKPTFVPDLRVRLVQEGVPQAKKWDRALSEELFVSLLRLSALPATQPINFVIWPETASAYYLLEDPAAREAIARILPVGGKLLTGVVRRETNEKGAHSYFNSLIAIDDHARVVAGYDKVHLVPFGEFMPFRSFLPVAAIAGMGMSDFTAGEGMRTLRVPGIPLFSPLICYESIFSGDVIDPEDPPQMLINVTNDAWYEHTTGPDQHFAIARVRAIEEGLPLLRSANLGTIGVVDPLGRIVAIDANYKPSVLDSRVPAPLQNATLFASLRWKGVIFLTLFAFLVACVSRFLNSRFFA